MNVVGTVFRIICTLLLAQCLATGAEHGGPAAEGRSWTTRDANTFFGLTNLWIFHLRVASDDWTALEARVPFFRPPAVRGPMRPEGPDPVGPLPRRQPPVPQPGIFIKGKRFPVVPAVLEFEGKEYGRIGIRFKGNSSFASSRGSLKKPFKLDFNRFVKGQKFFGLTKLNLNNNAMDPSQLREALGYEIYRTSDIPAARTAFARVYLTVPGKYDHEYVGLYTVVEQIGEQFLQDHFRSRKALLVKPEMGPGLVYLGDRWESYREPYNTKSEGTASQQAKFIAFAKLLKSDDETFRRGIGSVMDTNQFLDFLAVTVAEANTDSVLAMGHNFYLMVNPQTEKVQWIPWDLNLAFGPKDLSVVQPAPQKNLLVHRILAIPEMKEAYGKHLRRVLDTSFRTAKLQADIDAMAKTIRPAVAQDPHLNLKLFDDLTSDRARSNPETERELPRTRQRGPDFMAGPRQPLKAWISGRVDSINRQLTGRSNGQMFGGRIAPASAESLGTRMFFAADANGDGRVTRREFINLAAEWFNKWNGQQREQIGLDDIAAGLADVLNQPLRPRPSQAAPPFEARPMAAPETRARLLGREFLREADADRDGLLTRQELETSFGNWFDQCRARGQIDVNQQDLSDGMGNILRMPGPFENAPAARPRLPRED